MEVKSKEAAQKAVKRGAELSAMLAGIIATQNKRVLAVQQRFGGTISQLSAEITSIETALADWARGNRSEFGEKQSLEFPCGVLAFHKGKPEVSFLKGWDTKKVIAAMVRRSQVLCRWRAWVRVKFELHRQNILSDFAKAPVPVHKKLSTVGLHVTQQESFEVEFRVKTKLGASRTGTKS